MYSNIRDLTNNRMEYNLHGLTKEILAYYKIDNISSNFTRVQNKLKEILQKHDLWRDKESFYTQAQLNTFIREINPYIKKTSWDKRMSDTQITAIKNLGDDLSRYTYTMSRILDYITSKITVNNTDKARATLRQRLQVIINTYRKMNPRWAHTNTTFTISRTYELLAALKPYLLDHNNTTIVAPFAYSQRNFVSNLIAKYHIDHDSQKGFRNDLFAYNFAHLSQNQTNRLQIGSNNLPSYFTQNEVKVLNDWAKEHAAKYKTAAIPDKPVVIYQQTEPTSSTTTQHSSPRYDEQGNYYYCLSDFVNLFLNARKLPDTTKNRNNMAHLFKNRLKAAYESGAIKAKKNSRIHYNYPAEIMTYFRNHLELITKPAYHKAATINSKTTNSTKTTDTKAAPTKPPVAEQSKTVATYPKLTDPKVQLEVMLKRFLSDRYDILIADWQADQVALKQLDTNSAAYQTIQKRLLDPAKYYLRTK